MMTVFFKDSAGYQVDAQEVLGLHLSEAPA